MWSDPELDFRKGSWGQRREQKGQEKSLEPHPPPNPVTKCKGDQILSKGNCWTGGGELCVCGGVGAAKLSLQKRVNCFNQIIPGDT